MKSVLDKKNKLDDLFTTGRTAKDLYSYILSIEYLLKKQQQSGRGLLKEKIWQIKSDKMFCDWPVVYLPPQGEAIIIGDTHGDSEAVRAIVRQENFVEKINKGQEVKIIFLGDYADRGLADIKNLETIMSLVRLYPKNVILLRGNHEEVNVGQYYGFFGSCLKQFGFEDGQMIFNEFNDLFEKMPVVAVAGNGLVALHGGVPTPSINTLYDLQDEENAVEMRWNDPTEEIDNYAHNYKRGCYFLFGKKVFNDFMSAVGGTVLVRSHEYTARGYKLLFDGRLLTIFSNGGKSKESGYRDFILSPKYAKLDLSKPINRWVDENIKAVEY